MFWGCGSAKMRAPSSGNRIEWFEKPRCRGHFHCLYRQSYGFDAAIHAVFPKTEIQNCIIHQLRNSSKYVSYKDLKALMADLKAVYAAVDEQAALDALDVFGEHWDKKIPENFPVLEGQLGQPEYLLQVSPGGPAADLYHQYH